MKKLNAFQLKIIAIIVMLMDHLYFAFPDVFSSWFHPLSRFVAPLFVYLMVEGLFYTRNKLKYNLRIFSWAIIMQSGNMILNFLIKSNVHESHNNIFMTLALALFILNLFELRKIYGGLSKIIILIFAVILIPVGLFVEGGFVLIPFALITYFLRGNMKKTIVGYIILSLLVFKIEYVSYETIEMTINMLIFNSDFLAITAVPFILLYNGERGLNNKFSKYMFYVFYPLHLWILTIISYLLSK